jgi:glycosidase
MKFSSLMFLSASLLTSQLASADWFFRGTPNTWGSTAMTVVSATQMTTCQTFTSGDATGGPRFKIDKLGTWSESYPSSDYGVNNNQAYKIDFNITTKAITVQTVTSCTASTSSSSSSSIAASISSSKSSVSSSTDAWYFRGTPNNWASTVMALQSGLFCSQQTFGAARTSPRFKVDHFANWTESYPSSDYTVSANTTYNICFNASTHAISLTTIGSSSSSLSSVVSSQISSSVSSSKSSSSVVSSVTSSAASSSSSTAGLSDFRKETIYFLLTARFYDGDSSNNYYNRDRYKAGDPHWRGDFKGLISKLDYIKDLGFTAIWVTPPVENRSGLDYHGYHAYDFYKVDPRLESADTTYKTFIDAAHAKGLKVIQDVVINHSSQYGLRNTVWIDHLPIKYYVPAGSTQSNVVNGPYLGNLGDYKSTFRDDNDNSVAPQWFKDRNTSDAAGTVPLVDPKSGSTVPAAGYNPNRFFGIDAATLDPNWYHLDGFMAGGDWESPLALQRKHMAGDTIDLATERQNVKDYINGAMHKYLDMGVDAIRLDTVKHVERNELLTYVNDWKSYKPGLFVFGENLVKGTGFGSEIDSDNASAVIRPWWYTRTTSNPANPLAGGDSGFSVLDFSVFSTFRDNVTKGHFGGIGGVLSKDWVYGDATKLVTFFQNHDVGPDNDFKYRYGGDPANAAMVYNLLWTNRGIPTLYYGEEVEFQGGLAQDISGNSDTIDQTGRAYYGPTLDSAATPNHVLYQHIKRLNQIRAAVPALQKAPSTQVNEWGAGISYVRDLSAEGSYAVVGLASGNAQSISVSGVKNGIYKDAVTGNTITVSNGTLSFSVASYSAGIYVLNGPGKIGISGTYLR